MVHRYKSTRRNTDLIIIYNDHMTSSATRPPGKDKT